MSGSHTVARKDFYPSTQGVSRFLAFRPGLDKGGINAWFREKLPSVRIHDWAYPWPPAGCRVRGCELVRGRWIGGLQLKGGCAYQGKPYVVAIIVGVGSKQEVPDSGEHIIKGRPSEEVTYVVHQCLRGTKDGSQIVGWAWALCVNVGSVTRGGRVVVTEQCKRARLEGVGLGGHVLCPG